MTSSIAGQTWLVRGCGAQGLILSVLFCFVLFCVLLVLLVMVLLAVLEFENGSREEELSVVFMLQRGNFRMVGVAPSSLRAVWLIHLKPDCVRRCESSSVFPAS